MYQYIKTRLTGYYTPSECGALARWILTAALHLSAMELYCGKDANFSPEETNLLTNIITRLRRYEPMQYILGRASFCSMELAVGPGVLIPRPETEELVEWIAGGHAAPRLRVLDIGTGSGCIAIALALRLPGASVTAWDVSPRALAVASLNARSLGADITFAPVDILSAAVPPLQADIIVSNPPYVTLSERAAMSPNVLDWEPAEALFVPDDDPLLYYRAIARQGLDILSAGGELYLEVNSRFGGEVMSLLRGLSYRGLELRRDLSGNDRMIKAIRP